jgi:hypothetical protein
MSSGWVEATARTLSMPAGPSMVKRKLAPGAGKVRVSPAYRKLSPPW